MDKSLIAEIEKEDIDVITLPLSGCLPSWALACTGLGNTEKKPPA